MSSGARWKWKSRSAIKGIGGGVNSLGEWDEWISARVSVVANGFDRRYHERGMGIRSRLVVGTLIIAASSGAGLAQTTPDKPVGSVRIFGRLVYPPFGPERDKHVYLARIEPDRVGTDAGAALTDSHGVFTFDCAPAKKYRLWLGMDYKGAPKVIDTASGKDTDLGDLILESCPNRSLKAVDSPAHPLGDLKLEQILIEAPFPYRGVPGELLADVSIPLRSNMVIDPPECWDGGWSPDQRAQWEHLCDVRFHSLVSLQSFVGGKVSVIRVDRFSAYPERTLTQIREEVRKVWLGKYWDATCSRMWSEMTSWKTAASIEFDDGKRRSLLIGNGHVYVQDRNGTGWYLRPAPGQ